MKIIDEKGRLFGKINVIDFLVIFFLLWFLTPMFYFGYKLYARNKNVEPKKVELDLKEKVLKQSQVDMQKKEFIEMTLKFFLNKLEPKTLNLISVGDEELDEEGEVIGEIVSLEKPEPVIYEIDTGENKNIFKENPLFKKMFATLKIKAELKQNMIYYKDKQILLNSSIDFKTDKYQVEAIYVSSKEEDLPTKEEDPSTFEEKAEAETTSASTKQLDDIINRITTLEDEMDDKEKAEVGNTPTLTNQLNDIANRISTLEQVMDDKEKAETEITSASTNQLGDIAKRIATLEQVMDDKEKTETEATIVSTKQLNNIIYNMVSIEKKMDDLNNNIASMEKTIGDVNNRIATVEKKVNFILSSPKIRKLIGMKD